MTLRPVWWVLRPLGVRGNNNGVAMPSSLGLVAHQSKSAPPLAPYQSGHSQCLDRSLALEGPRNDISGGTGPSFPFTGHLLDRHPHSD